MGKTRKDRNDWNDDYMEKASRRKKKEKRRHKHRQNWVQFRSMTSDDVSDDCMVKDD